VLALAIPHFHNHCTSWRQQPGTPAYCQDLDAAALRRALAEADRSRIAEYRAEQEARIRRLMAAQKPPGG